MAISKLRLEDFRNHAATVLNVSRKFIVISGANGAGKTNIMEAVSLLSPGRGLRADQKRHMIREGGAGGFSIAAILGGANADMRLGTGINAQQPGRRLVRINGAEASANAMAQWLSITWLTPAMDRLFADSASARRRFLDRLVLALRPSHAHHLQRFEAAMRERNRLLSSDPPWDESWLKAVEGRMAEHASAISYARHEIVQRLDITLDVTETGVFAKPSLVLDNDTVNSVDNVADWAGIWALARRHDAAAGRTLAGPHRDDLSVVMRQNGRAAYLCSTGEQKAMLISLILAHCDLIAESGQKAMPILLLDEVSAHLDAKRRHALFNALASRPGQVWMTGTDYALFEGISDDHEHIIVADGCLVTD